MPFYVAQSLKKLLFLLIFCPIFLNAQDAKPPLTDWEKPPKAAELDLKIWAADTAADALVLNHEGWIRSEELANAYGFVFNERKRIKILRKSAFDRANIRLVFVHKDGRDRVNFVKARTWLPSGRKVEIESKGFITEKINENVSVVKFSFPQVAEGAILEYEWDMESTDNYRLRQWVFQSDIPVLQSVLNLNIFSRYEYVFLTQGEIKTTKPNYTSDKRTEITFFTTDLPALREEAFISTMDDYVARINFQLSSFYDLQTGAKRQLQSDWEKTARDLNDDEQFGKRMSRRIDPVWKALAPSLTEGDTGMARVQKIYDFVNSHITENSVRWFSNQSGDDTYKKGKGSSADINLLLAGLLREAGIEAYPALVSTRDNGRMYEAYPLLDQFNHVLVQVAFPDGRTLLIDGGNNLRPLGVLRESALNNRACVIKKKTGEWIGVKPPTSSGTTALNLIFDAEGTLKGSVQRVLKGYIAVRERGKIEGDKAGNFVKKDWGDENPDLKIDSIGFQHADNPKEALREMFKLTLPNAVQNTNDLLYLKPVLNSGWEINPFKIPTRHFPVDIPYPFQDQFILNLELPKGYKIEELPKPIALALPNKGGDFSYNASTSSIGNLQINVRIRVSKTLYTSEEYPSLKKFFDAIADKLQEMVVLKKEK